MWRAVGVVVLTGLLAGCGAGRPTLRPGPRQIHHAAHAALVAGGCGATRLLRGAPPAWTASAFADSSPGPPPWPFALSARGTVVAIVFGYPLRAGHPTDRANKVLWIVRLPRHGSPLRIESRPLHARAPLLTRSWPADSSPGEIYPSYADVPSAGCWRLSLRWDGHADSIDLRYARPRSA